MTVHTGVIPRYFGGSISHERIVGALVVSDRADRRVSKDKVEGYDCVNFGAFLALF